MTDFTKIYRRGTYGRIDPALPQNDQSGRTILISGGSDGIGFNIADAYAQAHANRIVVVARHQERLASAVQQLRENHRDTTFFAKSLDMSDVSQIVSLWEQLARDGIFIDVLFNNAGPIGATSTAAEAGFFFHFNVTCRLHMLESFQAQKQSGIEMPRQKFLVDISSASAHNYMYPRPAYAASRAAIANYLCHMADFTPESEMRIHIMHPGIVYTPATQASKILPESSFYDHPSLSAHFAVWLTGKEAGFLHGRYVWANWDVDELLAMQQQILDDRAFLKVGITGVESLTMDKIIKKTEEVPVPTHT